MNLDIPTPPTAIDTNSQRKLDLVQEYEVFQSDWIARLKAACGVADAVTSVEGKSLVFDNPWSLSGLDVDQVTDTLPWSVDRMNSHNQFMTINKEAQHYYSKEFSPSLPSPFSVNEFSQLEISAFPVPSGVSLPSSINSSDQSQAINHFISGNLNTYGKRSFLYGYFEMRCKLPKTCGSWPAFFLLDANFSQIRPHEIDIFEYVISCVANPSLNDRHVQLALHMTDAANTTWSVDGYGIKKNGQDSDRILGVCNDLPEQYDTNIKLGANGSTAMGPVSLAGDSAWHDDFHTFALLWEKDRLVWLFDGVPVASLCESGMVPNEPMCLIANLAVGGTYPGDAPMNYKDKLVIDSLRVWQ